MREKAEWPGRSTLAKSLDVSSIIGTSAGAARVCAALARFGKSTYRNPGPRSPRAHSSR